MKKLLAVFTIAIGVQSLAMAQGSEYKAGDYIRITATDSLQTQLLAAGETVEIFGWLGNDLFSFADFITIDGIIEDDALVAAQNIIIRGTVKDMVAAAGETIIVDSNIEGDLFVAAREVRITDNAQIQGNAYIAAASIIFEGGTFEGILRAAGGSVKMNGTVNNKVIIYSSDVAFGNDYTAEFGTDIYSDETVYRENLGHIPANLSINVEERSVIPLIFFKIGFYISLLITGLVLIRIFQQTTIDIFRFSTEQIAKNTAVGLLTFIIVPVAVLILIVLVLTIPLSVILILTYGLALFISYLLVAMVLGVMSILYFQEETSPSTYYWGLLLGMVYIGILVNLPFIGWLFQVLLLFFGLGSLVYYIWMMSMINPSMKNSNTEKRE